MSVPKRISMETCRMHAVTKNDVERLLTRLPEDSTLEDVQYHLYVLEKVQRGLARAEQEGTLSHAEAEVRLQRWLTE